ncbi:viral protein 1 [Alphapolyomavirus callosciuri]|uniref:Viral protein 1 n=1 Tax=Alphapolyomavirus callosciuri TaxID=2721748 RepID=A0A6G9LXA2_9POLY|nr:viral protein 1 [Alphapolyomavirus callosciuri]QIQ69320.1 viral protein 1 [Alphapolyomavirus callosciuri]QIQ69328.1 viral protein 1 [Alphapolyomavirus callosciuri]
MAPKKRARCVTETKEKVKCITKKKCPTPSPVPKLLIKGGVEVLNVITGPDSTTEIELYLNPRMGINTGLGTTGEYYGFSEEIAFNDGSSTSNQLTSNKLPQYSCARVQLPMLNEDLTCETLRMWEAVSCKTEVVGVGTLLNLHLKNTQHTEADGFGRPIEGMNYHFFAVGGEPLDLQGIEADAFTFYATAVPAQTIHVNDIAKVPLNDRGLLQGLLPTAKAKLDKDGFYPIEEWHPDPSRNENSRYFGSFVGGTQSPPSLQFTNSVTTVLLDENGVGPLCKGDGLFVSSADICGLYVREGNKKARYRGLPRYFKITLRKRVVKNPYPITSLLGSLFSGLMPKMDGQPMAGKDNQIEEVRVYQGMEGLPGDPDLKRYIDQFGQEQTTPPTPAAPAADFLKWTFHPQNLRQRQEALQKQKEEFIKKYQAQKGPSVQVGFSLPGHVFEEEEEQEASSEDEETARNSKEITEHHLITEDYSSHPPTPALSGSTVITKLPAETGQSQS